MIPHGPELELPEDDCALLERLWQSGAAGAGTEYAAFAFDPDRHPRDQHGRWANLEGPSSTVLAHVGRVSAEWVERLKRDEVHAVREYKSSLFYPLNQLLRSPNWPDTQSHKDQYGERSEAVQNYGEYVAYIDSALKNALVERPLTVHRGVSGAAKELLAAFDAGALTPGTEFADAGFVSTSLDPKAATSFKKGWGRSGSGAVMHIALSPGDCAAYLGRDLIRTAGDLMYGTGDDEAERYKEVEYEMLLPRGTTFRVLRTYEQGGLRHIDCAVVKQVSNAPVPFAATFYDPDQQRDERGRWAGLYTGDPSLAELTWARAFARTWAARLSAAEARAVEGYRGADFYAINKMLRDPEWPESEKDYASADARTRSDLASKYRQQVALIDGALEHSYLDGPPLVAHRGVSASAAALCRAFDAGALTPGTEFTDSGFVSTSLRPELSDNFKRGWSDAGPGMILHVALEPGQRGAYIGNAVWNRLHQEEFPLSHKEEVGRDDGEYELLLPRNTTFRVRRTYQKDGVRHVDCEVSRQDAPAASFREAHFYHPEQVRDAHGRWTTTGGGEVAGGTGDPGATEPAGGADPSVDPRSEPTIPERPLYPHEIAAGQTPKPVPEGVNHDLVERLAKDYGDLVAQGATADPAKLETWRYGMGLHRVDNLRALHKRLGLPQPESGLPPVDPHGDMVRSLYAAMGRPVPHHGDNIESRQKLAEIKTLLAKGAGREARRDIHSWLSREAELEQVYWLAEQFGFTPPDGEQWDGRSDAAQPIRDLMTKATQHPGEAACEDADWPRQVRDALRSKSFVPIPPDFLDKKLQEAGPDAADYLVKVLDLYTPGMDFDAARGAVRAALTAAVEAHGKSPLSEAKVAEIRALPDGRIASWRDREAFRKSLDKLIWQEQGYLHRQLGLVGTRSRQPVGADAVKEIMDAVTPPVADRMSADTASAAVVARLADHYDRIERLRVESENAINANGSEMVKYFEAREAAGTKAADAGGDSAAARKAWEALPENREWYARVQELNTRTEALFANLGLNRERDRALLFEAMTPVRPVSWKIKNAKPNKGHKAAMTAAVEFFGKVLSHPADADPPVGGHLATVTLRPTKTRARAQSKYTPDGQPREGTVWLQDDSTGTAVHELGHHVEYHSPGVKAAALEFLAHRVKDEPLQSLKALFKDYGYKPGERGRADDFGKYFGAGDHRAYYCGKHYDHGTTEIVSMGCEYLYKDPLGFCKKDPEFAQFIIGILRGTTR